MTRLTFDESAAEFILESFSRETDGDGYVINPETGERETTESGEEIHKSEFTGVEKGSVIFLDEDFTTLADHVKRRQDR